MRSLLRKKLRIRRPVRLTFAGKLFLGVTVGVGLAAVNTGNNLLYLVLGLMLSLLLLSGVLSELALSRIHVARRLPRRAFASTVCLVEIVLRNRKRWLPSYSLEVEDHVEGERTERRCYFLKIAPRTEQVAAYRRTPQRRGVLRLSGYKVSTRYPFGLIEKARIHDDAGDLLVFPALVPVLPAQLDQSLAGAEAPTGRLGPGTEVVGIRPYRPGDEARVIHWRRSAALGQLAVRETERDSISRLTIQLDNRRPATADQDWDDAFELAVSRAASLAAAALARGAAVDVVTYGDRSPLVLPGAPPDPIWAFLALVSAVPREESSDAGLEPTSGPTVRVRAHEGAA